MSTPDEIFFSKDIENFYASHLREFGNSAKGVGWKNTEAQYVRFDQLLKVVNTEIPFSINDLGCGVGELYKYLVSKNLQIQQYNGYDILPEMVQAATDVLSDKSNASFKVIADSSEMSRADYSIESGIFNVKYAAKESDWMHYVLKTLDAMNEKSEKGFSFNLLTKYSDKEFMQEYLYYADPLFYFDYCKRNYAKNVALLHDYTQYDFTILVRK
jgi:SAM-dependent methyltransferase